MLFSSENKALIKNLYSSMNTVHGGYWRNCRR